MQEDDINSAQAAWRYRGQARPPEAVTPGPGQESVWDYPRPPALVDDQRHIQIRLGEHLIAATRVAKRVLETASPPTFYLPPAAVRPDCLRPETGSSYCEWKGQANYYSVWVGAVCVEHAAWCYHHPQPSFEGIRDYLAFYPNLLACYVDGERVRAQAGGFYGGWVTAEIVGPYKGEPGTATW